MNYTEAVKLAKNGDEAGFNFLYQETYRSKYYLALKYMQNEEAAKDVVQDAYIRAFEKLDTLENPESFASWLGIIVANTAKNALKKKNPMLFTDISIDSEQEKFEYQIEDESVQNQPEIAYSQKETQELVHELIDSLSEEQRMCILMFHIEGQSISEIAEALGCSENTVKSRLNYGRKNIKVKAEELQKKGYKLYSFAPVPFLLYLLKSEEQALAAQRAFEATGKAMADHIAGTAGRTSSMQAAEAKMATEAVKRGFIHTLAGKLTMAGVGLCLVAGVTVAINSQKDTDKPVQNTTIEEENGRKENKIEKNNMEEEKKQETDSESEDETEEIEVEVVEGQYPELLEGGITKEQFEFALEYGPQSMANGEVSLSVLETLLFRVCVTGDYYNLGINSIGEIDVKGKPYSLAEINNYISVLTKYQFEEADNNRYEHTKVSGETLYIPMAEPNTSNYATIQRATLKGDIMKVEYEFDSVRFSDDTGEEVHNPTQRIATLRKTESGRYRVTDIADARMVAGRREAYVFTLENLYTNHIWPDGTEMDVMGDISENVFAVYDIDGDGEEELIIKYDTGAMSDMVEAIYDYDSETGSLRQELLDFPSLVFYDNGFIRADASHNQGGDIEAWPYTMYEYHKSSDTYQEAGGGVSGDGSIESYVGNGKEVEVPYMSLTEKNIQSIL